MAIGNYGYGGYPMAGGYYPPPMADNLAQLRAGQYQQPMPQPVQNQPQQIVPPANPTNSSNIIWVNGEKEADDFLIAPNNAVVLWDSTQPVVYIKQADATGKPSKEIYDLVKRSPVNVPNSHVKTPMVEYATVDMVEALEAKFDAFTAKKQTSRKNVKEDDE